MNEESIFAQACAKKIPAERIAYLDGACGTDRELRNRVEHLLAAHAHPDGFLDAPPSGVEQTVAHTPFSVGMGSQIGRYKLLEEIGEGGMGTVWVAEQADPVRRKVALKLVKAGMDSRQVVARFNAERQALAVMDHPNIAKVYDGGLTEQGRPYFVMEYVKGVPLTEYCDQAKTPLRERLELFVPVCQAVQHAHQKGIIHRDLKPSNILACLYDGKPVPKVIDFGLAKAMHQPLTDQTLHTAHGMMLGTPMYMSPEQAEFNNLDVDTRTDIYSLGVILYELLTGTTPLEKQQFKEAAMNEIQRLIKEVEPPKPSTRLSGSASLPSIAAQRSLDEAQLRRSVRGDLDWIVMKALDKERSRRYETANGLARDIERYLNEEAVEACPPSAGYRLSKFARKHRVALWTSLAFAVLLLGSSITCGWWATEAIRQRRIADHEAEYSKEKEQEASLSAQRESLAHAATLQQRYFDLMNLAYEAWNVGDLVRMGSLLGNAETIGNKQNFECRFLRGLQKQNEPEESIQFSDIVTSVAEAPNGSIAVGLGSGEILLRRTFADSFQVLEHSSQKNAVRDSRRHLGKVLFAVDGAFLIAACPGTDDIPGSGLVKIWELESGKQVGVVDHNAEVHSLAVAADDRTGVSGDAEGRIKAWQVPSGNPIWEKDEDSAIEGLAFSPDGLSVASGCTNGTVRIRDVEMGDELASALTNPIQSLVFSVDGQSLIVADDHEVRLWRYTDASSLSPTVQIIPTRGWDVSIAPSGRHLAVVGPDAILRVWDIIEWKEVKRYIMHHAGTGVTFGSDRILAASLDRQLYSWSMVEPLRNELHGVMSYLQVLDVGNGRDVITARESDNSVLLWNQGSTETALYQHDSPIRYVTYSPDRTVVASSDDAGVVLVHEIASGIELMRWKHAGEARSVSFAPDGSHIASAGSDGVILRDRNDSLRIPLPLNGRAVSTSFSPDGKYLATGSGIYWSYGETNVWNLSQGNPQLIRTFSHPNIVLKTLFSPDGKLLAAIDEFVQGVIQVWDVPSFTKRFELKCHNRQTSAIDFLPDSSRLITASADGTVRFWDMATGARVGSLTVNEQVREIKVFHDGNAFVTASNEGIVRVWNALP